MTKILDAITLVAFGFIIGFVAITLVIVVAALPVLLLTLALCFVARSIVVRASYILER